MPDSVSGTGDRKGRPYGFMGTLSETWRAGEDARPCGLQRSRPFLVVGAGPRPACGRGTPQGGFSRPSADSPSAPPLQLSKNSSEIGWGRPLGLPLGFAPNSLCSAKPGAEREPH